MGARGPRSAKDLAVISSSGVVSVHRTKPPGELTDEQADEWVAVVNRMPAERFTREMHAMLAAHCRHVVTLRRVGQLIQDAEGAEEFDVSAYDRLLKMQERESRCIASLAVRLGFAYSTAYDKHKPKPVTAKKPWQTD